MLHRVTWQRDARFQDICTSYITNLCEKYGKNCVVVFDGYPDDGFTSSTKIAERHRRAKGGRAIDMIFDESTKFSNTSQKLFLANERNKKNFIEMLKKSLQKEGFIVKQSCEDADLDIVKTAIDLSPQFDAVVIVGEDTDLLVLLCALGKNEKNVYFRKIGRGTTASKTYSTSSFKHALLLEHLLFIHAFSGCDTVSAICGMGKKKIIDVIKKKCSPSKGYKIIPKKTLLDKMSSLQLERAC